jgi:uncharacterized membrane protein YagU involved in acid resistance
VGTVWTLAAFAFVIHVIAGFVFNNYFTYCLARFPQAAGTAGGLAGGLAYTITSLLSYGIAATIRPVTQMGIGEGYFLITFIGAVVLWVSRRMYK